MKPLDFLYYIAYHAYIKGNRENLGVFLINSLWISVFRFFILISLLVFIEVNCKIRFLDLLYNPIFFILFLGFVILANNIYLLLFNRKERIINGFQMSDHKKYIYWFVLIGLFFIGFIFFSYSAYLRKITFGS